MQRTLAAVPVLLALAGAALAQPKPAAPIAAPAKPAARRLTEGERAVALCQIDALLAAIDAAGGAAAKSPLCQSSFSLKTLPKYIAEGGNTVDFARLSHSLVEFHEFQALAANSAEQCAPLSSLQGAVEQAFKKGELTSGSNWEMNCRNHFNEMRFARALIMRAPDAVAMCQEWDAKDHSKDKRGDNGEGCRRVAGMGPAELAANACQGPPEKKAKCANFFRSLTGDIAACTGGSTGQAYTHRELCRAYVAFAKAGPAKNIALCQDIPACRALAGDAVGMAVLAERRVAADVAPAILDEAAARLAELDAGSDPTNSASVGQIDLRAERIARVRARLAARPPQK